MIKVLQKTFDVLEYAANSPHPVQPGETAEALGLPQPTAARILRDLAELGYLEQPGPRKGYRLGPVPYHLAGGRLYDDEFLRFVTAAVKECARSIGQSVLFAVRRRGCRYILCHCNFNPRFYIDTARIRFRDLYATGIGRILLAFTPEAELGELIGELGLPSASVWPEAAAGREQLLRCLGRIRTAREVEISRSGCGNFHVYARPVFRRRAFAGTVAANWNVDTDGNTSETYKRTISELAARLSEPPRLVTG